MFRVGFLFLLAALASPLAAQSAKDVAKDVGETAGDVVAKPLEDANLKKDEIPAVLLRIKSKPYDTGGVATCAQIGKAIAELDGALGPDVDAPGNKDDDSRLQHLAKVGGDAILGSFIPGQGIIREVSGANAEKRKRLAAIEAGVIRRGYLKGMGLAKGCKPPAAPQAAAR